MKKCKRDLYQEVTDKIIAALEQGVSPWVCPWDCSGLDVVPVNHATGIAYRGINVILLWLSQMTGNYLQSRWLTCRQANAAGGQVRKGEQGTALVFYKPMERRTGEFDGEGNEIIEKFPLLRSFTVFNLAQVDGLSLDDPRPRQGFEPLEEAEQLLAASGVVVHHGGIRAFYRPSTDEITLPDRDRFSNAYDYYATAMHELTHATQAGHRCGRKPYVTEVPRGAYSFEECVADIGCNLVLAGLGINGNVIDHASYIDGYLAVLKEDKKAIFKAAAEAQKAHGWIIAQAGLASLPVAA